MAKQKVTMKDIAKASNVSVATVSYVLNYSEKEKISHETRLKVLAVAKKLQYTPNLAARSLVSQTSHLIGIIINLSETNKRSKLYQYYDIMNELQREIYKLGYDVVILSTKELDTDIKVVSKRSLDAAFIIDMDESSLKVLANQYYVPIIFIDGYLEDDLFFKVLSDYETTFKEIQNAVQEPMYLVMEDYSNTKIIEIVKEHFLEKNIFINTCGTNLPEFLQGHQNQKGIVIGEILGMQVEHYVDNRDIIVISTFENSSMLLPDTKRVIISNKEKAKEAVKTMKMLMQLEYDENPVHNILIQPQNISGVIKNL